MSIRVRKRRALHNLLGLLAVSAGALLIGLLSDAGGATIGLSASAGGLWGLLHWRQLRARIRRAGDPHAPNRVFVRFLSIFEAVFTAAAWSLPLLAVVVGLLALLATLDRLAGGWGLAVAGAFGVAAAGVSAAMLRRHERSHGAVYYQYATEHWGGGESLLFQHGTVVRALAPEGMVRVEGSLWRARSSDGRHFAEGAVVEVIDRDGLCLLVAPAADAD
ncbi:NfeD family protein [Algiphilus aromaticivorans]|uniref:NfeD family protein n=1 Tax=Algiphilus aromaticivorans TaxID=382454 RepID=UPI0006944430|nr:NfeD family protein [Algiphilus aromaticivorans]